MADDTKASHDSRYWILRTDDEVAAHGGAAPEVRVCSQERYELVWRSGADTEAARSGRSCFSEQMAIGDRVIVMASPNEVRQILELTGSAIADADGIGLVRSARLHHEFPRPFRTVVHAEDQALLDAGANERAQRIVRETTEAASGDGFTVDWSPLVNYY